MNLQEVLDALKLALNVVVKVAAMPGVNVLPYANVVASVTAALAEAVQFGEDKLAPYVEALLRTFSEKDYIPTPDEINALEDRIAGLREELHAALPPPEPGEPA